MKRAFVVLALLAAACATPEVAGTYTGALPASVGPGDSRQVRIILNADGAASVQATFLERDERYYGEGRWQQEGERIAIEVAGETPQRLVFRRSGQQLVATTWDRALWGDAGPPVMYRLLRR